MPDTRHKEFSAVINEPEKIDSIPDEPGSSRRPTSSRLLSRTGIIVALLLVQVAGSYFLQKALIFKSAGVAEAKAEILKPEKARAKVDKAAEEMKVIMLDELIVNPAETGGRRYLVVTLGLQTAAPQAEKAIEKYKPLVRDALISLLSSKHLDELSRISYRDTLRAEIRDAATQQLHGITLENVVFSSYVLQ